jgi:hypothetical protein
MSRRVLNGLILILAAGLVVILIVSDRGISGVMEECGGYISRMVQ